MKIIADEIYAKGFHIIDNFLDDETYQQLRDSVELHQRKGEFRQARIGSHLEVQQSPIRKDSICWLTEDTADAALRIYFNHIRSLAATLNETLFLGLVDFETHFAIYQKGSYYKKHVDQFRNNQDRRISCVYYLNDHWQPSYAGQLKLYDKNDQLLIELLPQANRFICFSSDLPHEVCITQETRYSIAGWMKTRSIAGHTLI